MVSLKEEGFASFMFLRKWLILKESVLTIHKTEVRRIGAQSASCARPNRFPRSLTDAMLHSLPQYKA